MIIYFDIMLIINTLITSLIIWTVAKINQVKIKLYRLIIALLISNFYTFITFYNLKLNLNIFSLLFNFFIASILIIIVFYPVNLESFFKLLFTFYLLTFLTIGTGTSIKNLTIKNKNNILAFVVILIIFIVLIKNAWKFKKNLFNYNDEIITIIIELEKEKMELNLLVDSGNKLYDPLTNKAVIVINVKSLDNKLIKNKKLKKFIKKGGEYSKENKFFEFYNLFSELDWKKRLSIIPYNVIGHNKSYLYALKVDNLKLKNSYEYKLNSKGKDSLVAFSFNSNLKSDSYHGLIGTNILESSKREDDFYD
ncbi:MAG: sigma-E processing peptidase SpoIIGA [Bacillota bacterium]